MFSFLKDKLKGAIKKFTKSADEESETIEVEEKKDVPPVIPEKAEKKPEKESETPKEREPEKKEKAPRTEPDETTEKEETRVERKGQAKEKKPIKDQSPPLTDGIKESKPKSTAQDTHAGFVLHDDEKEAEIEKAERQGKEKTQTPTPEPAKTFDKEKGEERKAGKGEKEETKVEHKKAEKVQEKEEKKKAGQVEERKAEKEEDKEEVTKEGRIIQKDGPTPQEKKAVSETPPEKAPEKKGLWKSVFKPFLKKEEPAQPIIVPDKGPQAEKEEELPKESLPKKDREELRQAERKTEPESPVQQEKKEEKGGFFTRLKESVTKTVLSEAKFDELFWELELALLENNVAVQVIEKMKADLKEAIVGKPIPRGGLEESVLAALRKSVDEIFDVPIPDLLELAKTKKPYVICFIGINGSGKTTSIAKVAHYLKGKGLGVVLAAGDTFRAAAIDQLALHAERLDVKIIKHDYGSDSAAVAFDAIKHAEAKGKDIVLIDTAGRMHSNSNLMDELKKVIRVAKPDLKVFVGESITGNDCVEQAETFDQAVGIDALILTKADIDEKGGAALSISYVTKKPIIFIGMGQEYSDLKPFSPEIVTETLGI